LSRHGAVTDHTGGRLPACERSSTVVWVEVIVVVVVGVLAVPG
jgi:hypothetical protein